MDYRILKLNGLFVPQYKKGEKWESINTGSHLYKNYSGVGTKVNAMQNMYEYYCTKLGNKIAISINEKQETEDCIEIEFKHLTF
jgi:hypothetical protein